MADDNPDSSSEHTGGSTESETTVVTYHTGTSGNDDVNGDAGTVVVDMGAGDDDASSTGSGVRVLMGGRDGDDTLDGGTGFDVLLGAEGDDSIDGGAGDDWLLGGEGADTLDGGEGNDTLVGGEGADTLAGGAGNDILTGGAGADTFVYAPDYATDSVTDFANGEDLIDLTRFTGITTFTDLTLSQDGNDVVIDLNGSGAGTLTLEDTTLSDIDAEDFVFYVAPVDDSTQDSM